MAHGPMGDIPPSFLCVGAAHWDIVGRANTGVQPGDDVPGRIEKRPGGVALNVALGLAAHGCKVNLCAAVGQDDGAKALLQHAMSRGVDCSHVVAVPGAASEAYVAVEDASGKLVAALADATLLENHADAIAAKAKASLRPAATIFLDANLPSDILERIAELARQQKVEVAVNPVSPAKAARLAGVLAGPGPVMIVANLAEANVLTAGAYDDARDAANALRFKGASTALVTNGAEPAALATAKDVVAAEPCKLPPGASVTGAGDALLAAFLAAPNRTSNPQAALEFALQSAAEHMQRTT